MFCLLSRRNKEYRIQDAKEHFNILPEIVKNHFGITSDNFDQTKVKSEVLSIQLKNRSSQQITEAVVQVVY